MENLETQRVKLLMRRSTIGAQRMHQMINAFSPNKWLARRQIESEGVT